jgi:hypothetical protein
MVCRHGLAARVLADLADPSQRLAEQVRQVQRRQRGDDGGLGRIGTWIVEYPATGLAAANPEPDKPHRILLHQSRR